VTRTRGKLRRPAALLAAPLVLGLLVDARPADAAPLFPVPAAAVSLASAQLPYLNFPRTGWTFAPTPVGSRPYESPAAASLVESQPHTAAGARLVVIGGKAYDHPVGQASRGLLMLNAYRVTHDRRYLSMALANASRLVATRTADTSVVSDGAWFYPHRYPFLLHGLASDAMPSPWYSSMAQGEALSLFTRLAVVTGDTAWRSAADRTFASFLVPKRSTGPWVTEQDTDGHIWLEEFASPSGRPAPDHTFNGHNFAAVGLYDYLELTGDTRAATLLDGALTSSLARIPLLRTPKWESHYCLRHPQIVSNRYHRIHIEQMLWFFRFTSDTRFARWADTLEADYPTETMKARLVLARGTHVGRRLDPLGRSLGAVTVKLSRTAIVTMDKRKRVVNGGSIWYEITSGSLAGTWVPERPGFAFAYGAIVRIPYPVARTLAMPTPASAVSVVQVASSGALLHSGTITAAATASKFTFDARGTVNGVDRLHISVGPWAGWWIDARAVAVDPV
jgi:hypothetical protein